MDDFWKRENWPAGTWDVEANRELWASSGFPCLIRRNLRMGFWCGYVGVPPGHPWYGKGCSDIDANVHGGLTYSAGCDGDAEGGICHTPEPGTPEDVWWLGFDCGHAGDVIPSMLGFLRAHGMAIASDAYRDAAYARAETERLAQQASGECPS